MTEAIITILLLLEIMITLGVLIYIGIKSDTDPKYDKKNNIVLSALFDFIKDLFIGRNIFGIILGFVAFILSLPAILILLLVEAVMWLIFLFAIIWDLGSKKNKWNEGSIGKLKFSFL